MSEVMSRTAVKQTIPGPRVHEDISRADIGRTFSGGTERRRTGLVARISAGTKPDRDRAIDGFRALAMIGVVIGHWLVGALVMRGDGSIGIASPLIELGFLAPASWFLQMLGLFFLVGGYSSALSLRRSAERGLSYGNWLKQRFVRLGRPVIAAAGLSAVMLGALAVIGVPTGTLRTWVVLFLQPLWFIGIYLVVTALTKVAIAMERMMGAWAAAPLLVIVAVVDILRYGPWQSAMPGWISVINLLPGWLFAYQLGVSWARGSLRKAGAWFLAIGGAGLFALLITKFGYPASMVGVPGAGRTNAHPPSLLVLALGATQSGLAILLHDKVNRMLQRPKLWAAVVILNLSAMTVFCWHQVPNVLASATASAIGGMSGLTDLPSMEGSWQMWLAMRLGWLVILGAVLAGIVAVVGRFEQPWKGFGRPARVVAAVLAVAFTVTAVTLY